MKNESKYGSELGTPLGIGVYVFLQPDLIYTIEAANIHKFVGATRPALNLVLSCKKGILI
jgi:hypothetical protein